MSKTRTWAIIGGGNGGQTMAGHLGIMGEHVRIFDVMQSTVDKLNETKQIVLHHAIEGVGAIQFATTDMAKALDGADNIIVVLPSIYHESMAQEMAPHLKDGQIVLLHPETCCGTIAFRQTIQENGCNAKIIVGSACNLIYATRLLEPGEVYVYGLKKSVTVAALPATDNQTLIEAIGDVFPMFTLTDHVLKISIDNTNAMLHPGPVILNTSRIEANPHTPYQYYREGITPSIGKVVHAMDAERIAIAKAFGFQQRTINQAYKDQYNYGTPDMTIDEIVSTLEDYSGIMAPTSLDVRYIFEDIPYNLVPLSSLGKIVGVPTPCIDAIIALGRAIAGDKMGTERTAEKMGIADMTKDELLAYINGK